MRSVHSTKLAGLDLNLMVALDALLEEQNVTRASERLALSQPAMSRALGRLRDLLGDALLVRVKGEMVPTPRAQALRAPLRLALRELESALEPPRPFDPLRSTHHFRFASSDYAQVAVLGQVHARLRVEAPRIQVSVEPFTESAYEALASGTVDLVVGVAPPRLEWVHQSVLLKDPWVCVRRRGLPPPTSLEAYCATTHVAVGTGPISPVDLALARVKKRREISVSVPDFAGALFVAATTDLTLTVPAPVAMQGQRLLQLELAPAPFRIPLVEVEMAWHARLTTDPPHRWFRTLVQESVRALNPTTKARSQRK